MKKLTGIVLLALFVLTFTGCDENAGQSGKPVLANRDNFYISSSSEGVESFLKLNEEFKSSYENDVCHNITPDYVADNSAYSVFKYNQSCATFLLYDGKVYALGEHFGGFGVTGMALADMNGDDEYELYFTFSWGSGMHRSQAGYFDPTVKKTVIFDYARFDGDMVFKTNDDGELLLYDAQFDGGTFTDFALEAEAVAATIVYKADTVSLEPVIDRETDRIIEENGSLKVENEELRDYILELERALNESDASELVTVEGMTGIGPENGAGEYGYIIVNGDCHMFPYYKQPVTKFKGYLFHVDARYSVYNSSGEDDMWIQISPVMPGYLYPGLQQYWIRQSDALPYSEETRELLRAPVLITEDTLDADGKTIEFPYPNVWILLGTEEGSAYIGAMGGISAKVNMVDIVYPDIETYGIYNLND
jgi:hypothetical protein